MGPSVYRWYGLSLVYVLAVLINWLACSMLAIAHSEGLTNSWLVDVKVRAYDGPLLTIGCKSEQLYQSLWYFAPEHKSHCRVVVLCMQSKATRASLKGMCPRQGRPLSSKLHCLNFFLLVFIVARAVTSQALHTTSST